MNFNINVFGIEEFRRAIQRNPEKVKDEVGKFMVRAITALKQTIWNNPWQVGGAGGGVPVNTGNLRDTHQSNVSSWQASIGPTAGYAEHVHNKRPWLDYALKSEESKIKKLESDMLKNIVNDLSK